MPTIYLDHAATTYTDPRVVETMLPYFTEKYGNPESRHHKGKEALVAIDNARETVAHILGCRPNEIIFTGSATETNNIAILGLARANPGKHLITTQIEHPSVTEPFKQLEKEGHHVTWLKPDSTGLINAEDFEKALTPNTALASIIFANNEIGTIQPIKELAAIAAKHKIRFHTDACQIAGSANLSTEISIGNIDLLTINGSKIYGPKGIGILFIRRGTKLSPILFGGEQEHGLRPGTHNTPNIIGIAKALELAQKDKEEENKRLTQLRDNFIATVSTTIPNIKLNGHPTLRLPNNISLTIPDIIAEELLLHLDEAGICISTGSACSGRSTKPSATLTAIGLSEKDIRSTIRLSLGKKTTSQDLKYVAETLSEIVKKLRKK